MERDDDLLDLGRGVRGAGGQVHLENGQRAAALLGDDEAPVRSVIVGIVDRVDVAE